MTEAHFGIPDTNRLAGLVFDLAAQLHAERVRRMALEARLIRSGLLSADDIEIEARTPETQADIQAALDQSLNRMTRIITEAQDPRIPLRAEAT
jgi:hypothetical protein